MHWTEIASNLPVGQNLRLDCIECGNCSKAASITHLFDKYIYKCFSCGHVEVESKGRQTLEELSKLNELNNQALTYRDNKIELPEDFTNDIPLVGRLWLYQGGLTPSDWKQYNIGYSEHLKRVVLPVYRNGELIWYQCRAVHKGQKPKYIQPSLSKDEVLFEVQRNELNECILVEDILSAIRVGKFMNTYSLLGTKPSSWQINFFSKFDKVTTWLDSDKAGMQGAYLIRRSLSLVTDVYNKVTKEDPKKLSNEQIEEELCK